MESWPALACVASIVVMFVVPAFVHIRRTERVARAERAKAIEAGRHQPVTIQPLVNLGVCMGAGACVTACPESVLKLIDGQAVAVNMSACIGHGACVAACPVNAIELVFGSDQRGIDIPEVGPNFETNVPGLFVAGELGGMGLIAGAADQGVQAMTHAAAGLRPHPGRLDVAIVGAGPAGVAAALTAKREGLRYVLLDQDTIGGAVRHYPRKKLVFTRPLTLPLYGRVELRELRKEGIVDLFADIVRSTGLEVSGQERVEEVERLRDGGFRLVTSKRTLEAQKVILALGRRGTPRKLEVKGEEQEKVAYSLLEPEHYAHDHLLVVGGGDSAVEAAVQLGAQPGNRVWLSYRGDKLNRPKEENLARLHGAVSAGRVELLLGSRVSSIAQDRVVLEQRGERIEIPNDYVFVMIGGVLPTKFLRKAGVRIARHFGKRVQAYDEVALGADETVPHAALAAPSLGARPRPVADAPTLPRPHLEAQLASRRGDDEPTVTLPDLRADEPTAPRTDLGSSAAPDRPGDLPVATMGATRPPPREQAAALRRLGDRSLRRGELEIAERQWAEALALGAGSNEAEARAWCGLARCKAVRGELEAALQHLVRAGQVIGPEAEADARAELLVQVVELDNATGRYGRALANGETLVELASGAGLRAYRAEAVALRAETLCAVGLADDAADAARQVPDLARGRYVGALVRAARVLCDLGRPAEVEGALRALPEQVGEAGIDDVEAQVLALRARVAARADATRGRALADQALARPVPLHAIRAARVRLDAARALIDVGENAAAWAAVKRGVQALQGHPARGLRLELLIGMYLALPDPRVVEALARTGTKVLEEVPVQMQASFRDRPILGEALTRWKESQ